MLGKVCTQNRRNTIMMTKGMQVADKTKSKTQDKDTNINCSKCGEVVGVVAAGHSIVFTMESGSVKQTCLCKCGNKMVFFVEKV